MNCIVHGVAKSQTKLSNFHFVHFKMVHFMVYDFHPNSKNGCFVGIPPNREKLRWETASIGFRLWAAPCSGCFELSSPGQVHPGPPTPPQAAVRCFEDAVHPLVS